MSYETLRKTGEKVTFPIAKELWDHVVTNSNLLNRIARGNSNLLLVGDPNLELLTQIRRGLSDKHLKDTGTNITIVEREPVQASIMKEDLKELPYQLVTAEFPWGFDLEQKFDYIFAPHVIHFYWLNRPSKSKDRINNNPHDQRTISGFVLKGREMLNKGGAMFATIPPIPVVDVAVEWNLNKVLKKDIDYTKAKAGFLGTKGAIYTFPAINQ